jgi:chromosome segregation ATPase
MNSPAPLDSPTASGHHDHEVRITRLEVTVENLANTVKLLQEHMDEGFKTLTALIHDVEKRLRAEMQQLAAAQQAALEAMRAELRTEFREEIRRVDARIDRLDDKIERLGDKIERLNARIDVMNRWAIGLFVTYLFGTVTLLARPYFGA